MRTKIIPVAALDAFLTAGCAYHGRDRVGVDVGVNDYYDGYYEGFYGPFNDGYWGNDGFFYYSDGVHNWHRDDGHHFAHTSGGAGWNHIHGSGTHRDH